MVREYGVEFPERALMAILSDLLGMPHFTTSRGSTVRRDFLEAVLVELGGNPEGMDKDGLIAASVEAATRRPFDKRLLSPGGTVTNEAIQVIVDGVTEHGVDRRLPPGRSVPLDERMAEVEAPQFDPAEVADERSRQLARRAAREGQNQFRLAVLSAYGDACAITGSDAVTGLEAAHITPYMGAATNVIVNGICLRADIHRLWDGGQIAIDERSTRVVMVSALRASTYGDLEGRRARLPHALNQRPSALALRAHREWCDL